MTARAILWCGQVRRPQLDRDEFGRIVEVGDRELPLDDAKIQANSLELAFEGALALGLSAGDVFACVLTPDLLPQRFGTERYGATITDLRRVVAEISKRSVTGDALLFIAVNHGAEDGLLTSEPPLDEFDQERTVPRLTPAVLDDCLRPFEGPQVIIVATCHAGVFLPLGRNDRVILAACAQGDKYYVSRRDHAWPAFLDQLFGAWCGFALADTITRTRLDLDAAFIRAHAALEGVGARNLPQRAGTVVWPPMRR